MKGGQASWKCKWHRTGPRHHLESRLAFEKLQDPDVTEEILKDLEKYVKDGHITVSDDGDVEFASGNASDDDEEEINYNAFKERVRAKSIDGEGIW